jgi:hypothetical protein
MVVLGAVSATVMLVTGVAVAIPDLLRRHRKPLADQLAPTPLADEVEEWLQQRSQ